MAQVRQRILREPYLTMISPMRARSIVARRCGRRPGRGVPLRPGEDHQLLGRAGHGDIAVDCSSIPSPNASGSTRTTRSNSRPFVSSGASDGTLRSPATPGHVGDHRSRRQCRRSSRRARCRAPIADPTSNRMTGTPLLRTDVGTLASGITALMTGSASAITSSGVR